MVNLEKASGLPIELKDDYRLLFSGEVLIPKIRDFLSLRNFLKYPSSSYPRRDVYHIYRNISLPQHREAIAAAGLEYSLTVIPPGKMGREFVKTQGHYHIYKEGTKVRYPEVCEVVYGKVFWLLQSASPDLERLESVYLVAAERGEKILIPPGFGHVSINPTDDVLILSSWQSLRNQATYDPYEIHNGAAYYVLESDRISASGHTNKNYEFSPNLTYNLVPQLSFARPRELPQYDLRSAIPIYFSGAGNLSALDFLNNPEIYLDDLTAQKLFK